jgi:hypothetical protein
MTNKPLTQDQLSKVDAKLKTYMANKTSWVKRYGKDAEKVMRGRAINTIKKETESMDKQKLKELVRKTLQQESNSNPITFDETTLFDNLFVKGGDELEAIGISDGNALMHQFKTRKTLENIDKKLSLYDIFSKGFSPEEQKNYDYNLIKYFETPQFSADTLQSYMDESPTPVSLGDTVKNQLDKYEDYKSKMDEGKKTKKATKDYDGDGKIEPSDEEYKGVKDKAIKKAMSKKGVKEGYYGTTNVESYIEAIGYDSFEDFFENNPGGEEALISWIESVPDFRETLTNLDILKEDLDLGHEDDEPHMIKAELYRIGKYAMELYQMVDGFEGKGEVDFPAWWQSKITKAQEMMVSAKHYLDFELKEPAIDAMVGVASAEDMIDNEEPLMEDEVTKVDKLAAKIAKALKDPKNKSAEDQNNIKQARKAMNDDKIETAEKIAKPYIDEDVVPGSNIRKDSKGKWRVLSGKTGKMWPQTYNSKKDAEDALQAYHANK